MRWTKLKPVIDAQTALTELDRRIDESKKGGGNCGGG